MRTLLVAIALVPLAALAAPIALVNPGFESTKPGEGGLPEGWAAIQHAGVESYDFALDGALKRSGTRSLRIRKIGPEPFGTIMQVVDGTRYAGRTVRLSGWMRTEAVPEGRGNGAGLVLTAMRGGSFLAHEFMKKSRVKGTTGWTPYTVELKLPPATTRVEVGATLEGGGTLWVDDFALEVVEP